MSPVENVSIFIWRVYVIKMAIYFNGGFHEKECVFYFCAKSRCDKLLMSWQMCEMNDSFTPLTFCPAVTFEWWCFRHCLPSQNPKYHSQVYRHSLRNGGRWCLLCYLFRQPINTRIYSVSKECRKPNILYFRVPFASRKTAAQYVTSSLLFKVQTTAHPNK